jgi:hypothetical protein
LRTLLALAGSSAAVAVACRNAAIRAGVDANKLPDPLPALALISSAEVYERMAKRHEPPDALLPAAPAKEDIPRPSWAPLAPPAPL